MKLYLSIMSTGANHDHANSLTLDHEGATIGRLEDNTLVLPDAKKYISGHHAVIQYRAPDYFITDTSTNGVLMNRSPIPLGKGNSVRLNDGDQIQIGDYAITVRMVEESLRAAEHDAGPFGDKNFDFPDDPFAEIGSDPIKKMIEDNELIPSDWKGGKTPLELPATPGDISEMESAAQSEPKDFEHIAPIKEAFQPFKGQAEKQQPPEQSPPPAAPGDIFDEDWFGGSKKNQPDEFPALKPKPSPFEDFPSVAEEKAVPPVIPAPKTAKAPPCLEPVEQVCTPVASEQPVYSPQAKEENLPPFFEKPATLFERPATPAPEPQKRPPASELEDELIQNFLRGAGLEGRLRAEALDPEAFLVIGKILKESVQGALDVLIGRTMIKNEMHLDVTMIRARQNNPIKFSVSAEEAMIKLLTVQDKAYLQPEAAIKEVFDDIRAHQFAVIAGMRTALLSVLKRFDPKKLEQRLQETSPIAANILIHKQAKLWSLFEQLYTDIGHEAEDNFYHLFGQAFAETYEQQLRKIKSSSPDQTP